LFKGSFKGKEVSPVGYNEKDGEFIEKIGINVWERIKKNRGKGKKNKKKRIKESFFVEGVQSVGNKKKRGVEEHYI
jgi:hypothetical protein